MLDRFLAGAIDLVPNSLADLVVQLVWWRRQKIRVTETKFLAAAAIGSDKTHEAAREYFDAIASGNDQEAFNREMSDFIDNMQEEAEQIKKMRLQQIGPRH